MNKMNRFRMTEPVPDYQNFLVAGSALYVDYSGQLADIECIQQVLEDLARSRGKTNDLCDPRPPILSED